MAVSKNSMYVEEGGENLKNFDEDGREKRTGIYSFAFYFPFTFFRHIVSLIVGLIRIWSRTSLVPSSLLGTSVCDFLVL